MPDDVEQREQWEDPLASQPERENELRQTNRSVRGVCVGVKPRLQSKLSRALHAHRGKNLLQDLQKFGQHGNEDSYGEVQRSAKKRAPCPGVWHIDTMEGPLWRETLGSRLGSHDAAGLVGGKCHGSGCRQETTRLHAASCTKTG